MNEVSQEIKDALKEGLRSLGNARTNLDNFGFCEARQWMEVANYHFKLVAKEIKMNGE